MSFANKKAPSGAYKIWKLKKEAQNLTFPHKQKLRATAFRTKGRTHYRKKLVVERSKNNRAKAIVIFTGAKTGLFSEEEGQSVKPSRDFLFWKLRRVKRTCPDEAAFTPTSRLFGIESERRTFLSQIKKRRRRIWNVKHKKEAQNLTFPTNRSSERLRSDQREERIAEKSW